MNEHEYDAEEAYHQELLLTALCNEIRGYFGEEVENAEVRAPGDLDSLRIFGPLTQAIDVRIGRGNHLLVLTPSVLDLGATRDTMIKFIHVLQHPLGDLLHAGHAILTWDADAEEFHAEPYDPRATR
ncbi:MAG: hypothetical protein HY271_06995 [Deltaproteobacteria bacterium]|nr:hypothetical protein [Deltaproteobacteria bacterium]